MAARPKNPGKVPGGLIRPRVIGWFPQSQLMKVHSVRKRKLACVVSLKDPTELEGPWVCGGIETSGGTVDELLDSHGHKNLGEHPTMEEAIAAADAYAEDWVAGAVIDACKCDEIQIVKLEQGAKKIEALADAIDESVHAAKFD